MLRMRGLAPFSHGANEGTGPFFAWCEWGDWPLVRRGRPEFGSMVRVLAVRGMRRLVAIVVAACAVIVPSAHAGLCDLLGTCTAPPGPALDPDGALHVTTPWQPLAAPVAGRPLFDRVDGHLQLGLTERGYDGSPNG